ncbi:MAG TPA: DUF3626 domain-containing protein [Bryobacteraceae bacterium]|nr:DUF3626 domain-containing protein [Bryobacteraceae bacterium]
MSDFCGARDTLSPAQAAALRHVDAMARDKSVVALSSISAICQRAGLAPGLYNAAMDVVRQDARIVAHFHPDRFGGKPSNVVDCLLAEGMYRNQFETGLSSGSPTAFPGGERDEWERTLFGAAYHSEGVPVSERPKYGSLELVRFPDGPAPRFGSCYFLLRGVPASITFMGSEHPHAAGRVGTLAEPHAVMAALLAEIEDGGIATPDWPPFRAPTLGVTGITVSRFFDLLKLLRECRPDPSQGEPGRVLDTGVEAQIHGPIVLDRDVETLVADPAFAHTRVGQSLVALADKYKFDLQWHCGFRLAVRDVPDDFRGPVMPKFAERIAGRDGTLDAAVIGTAAASLHHETRQWSEWGGYFDVLRLFRQLWHVLVHFGHRN